MEKINKRHDKYCILDCTGSLCIRCCTDETCAVHEEQRVKARWKEAVTNGTTKIQLTAKAKRARRIPKGRFKEKEFNYMNDTVVLWDLRTVLEPPPPHKQAAIVVAVAALATTEQRSSSYGTPSSQLSASPSGGGGGGCAPAKKNTAANVPTSSTNTNTNINTTISASDIAKYNNDLKIKEEILRRSRKNNSQQHDDEKRRRSVVVDVRRDYRRNTKRFRSVVEDMYQKSLKA